MCGSSGGGDSTVTQVKEMPAWAQPYAENLLQSGMQAIGQQVQPFSGMRVAPMNQAQQVGLSMIQGRALNGSPDEIAARQQATATAQGGYLGANPWLSAPYTQQAIEQNAQSMGRGYATGTAAQLDASAARARALGGTGYQQAVGQNQINLAGGDTDNIFRPFAPPLQKALGQTVVIANVGGASGTKGAKEVKESPADGYTLYAVHDYIHSTYYTGVADINYTDFEPICLISSTPSVLTASPKTPWRDWKGLIEDA